MDRKLAAIMMADLAGYSALMEKDAPAAIAQVRHMREAAIEPVAESAGGKIEKRMGDGWLITFSSAMNAVEAAQGIQRGLARSDGLKLRLAVHLGEIVEEDGEIYGSGINISARLQAQAPPGGVIISADCHRQLDPELADSFADAGTLELKNVQAPVPCFQWRPNSQHTKCNKGKDELPVIAVTPFVARPNKTDTLEAAADLQEQITHRLSQRTGLRTMQTDVSDESQIDATYLLRGRLRANGKKAQAILSLVLVETSHVFWSETFEGDGEDLFAFSDLVSDRAINALRVQINAYDGERLEHLEESVLTPSELRSRGAQLFHKGGIDDLRDCERLLARALQLDPDHPISLSMMCLAKLWLALAEFRTLSKEDAEWASAAADLAVRDAPRSYFVFFVRAQIRAMCLGDLDAATQDVGRVLRLNPGYSWGLETRGQIELMAGRYGAAVDSFKEAVEQSQSDPFLPRRLFWLALGSLLNEDLQAARRAIEEALELKTDCNPYWRLLVCITEALGDKAGADRAKERCHTTSSAPSIFFVDLKMPADGVRLLHSLRNGA